MYCKHCGHREDDHDHLSGITLRRDCEMPGCNCPGISCDHPRVVSFTAGDPFEECLDCKAYKLVRDGIWRNP